MILILGLLCFTNTGRAIILLETCSAALVSLHHLWTLMLTTTVTVLALSLKIGFSSSISPSMEIIEACSLHWNKASLACRQCFLLLLDGTHDDLCVPTKLFKKSRIDITMHPILAAFVVAVAALFVQVLGLWNY